MALARSMIMMMALATFILTALAFTRRLAPIRLPVRSLMPTPRYAVSRDIGENRKATRREYDRGYQERNKAALQQKRKEYRVRNKDSIKQYEKEYRVKNRDALREYGKQYYRKNEDAIKQSRKLRHEQNKDTISEKLKQERDLKRGKAIHSIRHRIAQHPSRSQHLLSGEEIDALYHNFLHEDKQEIFGGLTLAQAIASGKWTFYFGASKVPGAEEKLLWLTKRQCKGSSI
ncbi:hypothetical protein B484DRAFT_437256 [Ochromonadaceae sp. CCMP2298]|nr:hypothetical protein B484DRAFT_437256 [Ochromonadaceae sp. CCMP2298]